MLTIHKLGNRYYGYNPGTGEDKVGELFVPGINRESKNYKDFTPKMREKMKTQGGFFILLTSREREAQDFFVKPNLIFTNWLNFPEFHLFDNGYEKKTKIMAWISDIPFEIKEHIKSLQK